MPRKNKKDEKRQAGKTSPEKKEARKITAQGGVKQEKGKKKK